MNHVFVQKLGLSHIDILSVLIPVQSPQVDPEKLERTGTHNQSRHETLHTCKG